MKKVCKINYLYSCQAWRKVNFDIKEITEQAATLTLCEIKAYSQLAKLEFSINLADNAELQALNSEFRGKDKPTNVLSFPANEDIERGQYAKLDPYVGDIAISFTVIREEALEQSKSLKNHYAHMVVHAILHLMGYDHQSDHDAEIMEALEIKVLGMMSIANPYELMA